MAARRTLLVLPFPDIQLPEKAFHIADVLAEVVPGLFHAFFGHGTDLPDDIRVSLVVRKPPVLDFGQLPDGSEGVAEPGRDDVPIDQETLVSSVSGDMAA